MRRLSALLILAVLSSAGLARAQNPSYQYTHAYLASVNDTWQAPCAQNPPATAQMDLAMFAVPDGGTVEMTCYHSPITITSDIFSSVTKYMTLILPPTTVTINANVTFGSNFMLCYRAGSILTAGPGFTITDNSTPCNGAGGREIATECLADQFMTGEDANGNAICATVSGGVCNINGIVDTYVSNTGSDTTGDGTSGNPWQRIQHSIDQIPGLVCGRYTTHLAAGTYVENVTIAGRAFAGGGTGISNAAPDSFWPIEGDTTVTDDAYPYSWIEILGSTAAPASYVIQPTASNGTGIALSHANLTLRGVQIQTSGYGVEAEQRSFLNVAGVISLNNFTHFAIQQQSVMHISSTGYVNNAGTDNLLMTNSSTNGNNGILLEDNSTLTDYDAAGGDANLGTPVIHCSETSTGKFNSGCITSLHSNINLRGVVNIDNLTSNSFGLNLQYATRAFLNTFIYTGAVTTPLLRKAISVVTGSTFQGNSVDITNALAGLTRDKYARIQLGAAPTFTNVTNTWVTPVARGPFPPAGTFNVSIDDTGHYTITGDTTLTSVTGATDGDIANFVICEDGVGGHTWTWPINFLGGGTISTTAGACSAQSFIFMLSTNTWYAMAAMVTGL